MTAMLSPIRDRIVAALKEPGYRPIKRRRLAKQLGLADEEQYPFFKEALIDLEDEGVIVEQDDGTFHLEMISSKLQADGTPETVTFSGFTATNTGFDGPTMSAASDNLTGIDSIDVSTDKGAYIAMKKIDSALDQINSARATLGAVQSRFENAVTNISIGVENLSASRGRIMDADFAKETANLSRAQILQQAGTAMVAQANQVPQGVLSLLR